MMRTCLPLGTEVRHPCGGVCHYFSDTITWARYSVSPFTHLGSINCLSWMCHSNFQNLGEGTANQTRFDSRWSNWVYNAFCFDLSLFFVDKI